MKLEALSLATFLFVCAATPGRAQDVGGADAGPTDAGSVEDGGPEPGADAGEDACARRCQDGDVLTYCDVDAPAQLDCVRDLEGGARCGLLADSFGEDCLLGEGAGCDPDYAGGLSRCDRSASLYCVDGTCQVASGPPPAPGPLEPTRGTVPTATDDGTSSSSCLGCGGSSAAPVAAAALLLRPLRRRRRRA